MEEYMKLAIELAKKGLGYTNPNPIVGSIVVKDNKIIGQGYHERYGSYHAERNALLNLENAEGADLYVTLEPCSHFGKTPPCTDIIIEKKIKRVIIGAKDPNVLVSGKGIEKLKQAGIEVICGVLEKECLDLNEIFFHYIKTGMHVQYLRKKYSSILVRNKYSKTR